MRQSLRRLWRLRQWLGNNKTINTYFFQEFGFPLEFILIKVEAGITKKFHNSPFCIQKPSVKRKVFELWQRVLMGTYQISILEQ